MYYEIEYSKKTVLFVSLIYFPSSSIGIPSVMVVENTRTTTTHNLLKEKSPPIAFSSSSVSRVRSSLSTKNADWRSPPKSLSLSPALLCRRRLSKRVRPVQEERDQRCRVQIPKGSERSYFLQYGTLRTGKSIIIVQPPRRRRRRL